MGGIALANGQKLENQRSDANIETFVTDEKFETESKLTGPKFTQPEEWFATQAGGNQDQEAYSTMVWLIIVISIIVVAAIALPIVLVCWSYHCCCWAKESSVEVSRTEAPHSLNPVSPP